MALTPDQPFPKKQGDGLRSKDWNDVVTEVQRLDNAKVNRSGDTLTGPLRINGGNWDVGNTEGDLRIGSDSLRLKIGVATGGAGAGDARIRAHGGTNRLIIGGGTSDTLSVTASGVGIGTLTPNAPLSFGSGVANTKLALWDGGSATSMYGLGIQSAQFRLHVDTPSARFTFLDGPAGNELLNIYGSGDAALKGMLTVNGIMNPNSLVLNDYQTLNPASNVYLRSSNNDRDTWIFRDAADATSNWGIYHRQIDSTIKNLPANSIGFIGGGSKLQAFVNMATGDGFFAGSLGVGTPAPTHPFHVKTGEAVGLFESTAN